MIWYLVVSSEMLWTLTIPAWGLLLKRSWSGHTGALFRRYTIWSNGERWRRRWNNQRSSIKSKNQKITIRGQLRMMPQSAVESPPHNAKSRDAPMTWLSRNKAGHRRIIIQGGNPSYYENIDLSDTHTIHVSGNPLICSLRCTSNSVPMLPVEWIRLE